MTLTIGSGDMVKILTDLGSYYPSRIGSVSTIVGEGSTTWTAASVYGLVRPVNEQTTDVKEGKLQIGDARIFVLPQALSPTLEAGSPVEVQWNTNWYDAEQPMVHKIGNEENFEVANLRRII